MQTAQLIVSILGFGGTIAALLFGLVQYRRAEQWKRGEFVAREIKEFESNPEVRNAMFMIDWGKRDINLALVQNPEAKDLSWVTRETQWRALIPHPLKPKYEDPAVNWDEKSKDETKPRFTETEMRIRDTYDAFLGYLERFANYIRSDLVTAEEFKPYLIYWINSIANIKSEAEYEGDAEWRSTLLTFINYYEYSGVKLLFSLYGRNIEPGGSVYQQLEKQMENKGLYADLFEISVERDHP